MRSRWVDQDSPWESATCRAVAPLAEADHSRQPGVEGPLAEWCAQHVEDSMQVAEPRGSFIVVSKVEGHQVGEGFGSNGRFFRSRGQLFAEGTRKGPRGSAGTPFGGSKQRMPRIKKQGRASCREVGGRRCGREDHVGGRASTIESVGAAVVVPPSRVAQLEQQINAWCTSAMLSEPLPSQQRKRGPVTQDLHRARQRHTRC